MILAILLLFSGLTISAVAIYYSVAGLVAIFSAAAIPIMVMGISLEVGKLVIASWIKARWQQAPALMRYYAIFAVAILMVITSLGIFGFLSKAHSDQTLVSGDVQGKIAIYDEKIKTAKENIESDRKQLKQMDDAVDQIMGRSSDEKGADKANAVRKSQQKDRIALTKDIEVQQKLITTLNDEAAPIRAENRKVEAEVGPLKYIAAFIYGDNPDANVLERAVTWVIILIVVVFDPLAVVMLLAAQMTFGWVKEEKRLEEKRLEEEDILSSKEFFPHEEAPTIQDLDTYVGEKPTPEELVEVVEPLYEADDGPLTEDQIKQLKETVGLFNEPIQVETKIDDTVDVTESVTSEPTEFVATIDSDSTPEEEEAFNALENKIEEPIVEEVAVEEPVITIKQGDPTSVGFLKQHTLSIREIEPEIIEPETTVEETDTPNFEGFKDTATGEWIQTGPTFEVVASTIDTIDAIDTSHPYANLSNDYVEYEGKKMHKRVLADLRPDLEIEVDDPTEPEVSFGENFPKHPNLGDMFTRIDVIPHRIFKFNGRKWIEVSRENTDSHLSEDGYIQHLIEKIASGEYDPDHLTPNEQEAIAQYIKDDKQ